MLNRRQESDRVTIITSQVTIITLKWSRLQTTPIAVWFLMSLLPRWDAYTYTYFSCSYTHKDTAYEAPQGLFSCSFMMFKVC